MSLSKSQKAIEAEWKRQNPDETDEQEYWRRKGGQSYDAFSETDCAFYCLAKLLDADSVENWFDRDSI